MTAEVIMHPALAKRLHHEELLAGKRREVEWLEEWAYALRDRVKHWTESPWFDAGTQDIATDNAFDALAFARKELAGLEAEAEPPCPDCEAPAGTSCAPHCGRYSDWAALGSAGDGE